LVFEALRPILLADGPLLLDKRHLQGLSRHEGLPGGLCSKLHPCADDAGRVLRLTASRDHHSDLDYASALASGFSAFASVGCTIYTPPKGGMVDLPAWVPSCMPGATTS
jgi:hypothetical protein